MHFLSKLIYRTPIFLSMVENINDLSKPKPESVIGGDINTDYLTESHHKQCPDSLLTSLILQQ
jgi:hypothetical protein